MSIVEKMLIVWIVIVILLIGIGNDLIKKVKVSIEPTFITDTPAEARAYQKLCAERGMGVHTKQDDGVMSLRCTR